MSKKTAEAIRRKRDRFLATIPIGEFPLWDLSEERAKILMNFNKAIQAEDQS